MYVDGGGGEATRSREEAFGAENPQTVSAVEHYSTGVVSIFVASGLTFVFYPVLVALTEPFALISTTVLVFVVAAVWMLMWVCFEVIWEWRSGRLSLS